MTEVNAPGVGVGASDDAVGVNVFGVGATVGGGDDGGAEDAEEEEE